MGVLAVLLIGLAVWLAWTGRLQRLTGMDGIMLGVAIVGAVLAAKGSPIIGGVPLALALFYAGKRGKSFNRSQRQPKPTGQDFARNMDLAEARALLGIKPDASVADIRAAHRCLIATVHPDKGGTEALAAKINAARDILLKHSQG